MGSMRPGNTIHSGELYELRLKLVKGLLQSKGSWDFVFKFVHKEQQVLIQYDPMRFGLESNKS